MNTFQRCDNGERLLFLRLDSATSGRKSAYCQISMSVQTWSKLGSATISKRLRYFAVDSSNISDFIKKSTSVPLIYQTFIFKIYNKYTEHKRSALLKRLIACYQKTFSGKMESILTLENRKLHNSKSAKCRSNDKSLP